MLRRDFLQAFIQAFLFALFGRFHRALPAHVVENVEKVLFRHGTFRLELMIKGFEMTPELEEAVRAAIPEDEAQKLFAP